MFWWKIMREYLFTAHKTTIYRTTIKKYQHSIIKLPFSCDKYRKFHLSQEIPSLNNFILSLETSPYTVSINSFKTTSSSLWYIHHDRFCHQKNALMFNKLQWHTRLYLYIVNWMCNSVICVSLITKWACHNLLNWFCLVIQLNSFLL